MYKSFRNKDIIYSHRDMSRKAGNFASEDINVGNFKLGTHQVHKVTLSTPHALVY